MGLVVCWQVYTTRAWPLLGSILCAWWRHNVAQITIFAMNVQYKTAWCLPAPHCGCALAIIYINICLSRYVTHRITGISSHLLDGVAPCGIWAGCTSCKCIIGYFWTLDLQAKHSHIPSHDRVKTYARVQGCCLTAQLRYFAVHYMHPLEIERDPHA